MKYLTNDVFRLASTYLVIIMVMSISFSAIFYTASVHELGRRPHTVFLTEITQDLDQQLSFQNYLTNRGQESSGALFTDLVAINVITFIVGGALSYLLAKHTLRPIDESLEAQAQFVSDASHELRTPLTALRVANEVALRNKKLRLPEAKSVISENIDDIARLQYLADSMLGLLRDDTTNFQPDVSLSAVVGESLNMVISQAQAKRISVEDMTNDATLRGNAHSLSQLLTILLDNAIKYSENGTAIYIKSKVKSRMLTLSIVDEGIGMDQDTLDRMFTRFYRAEESRSASGYGLGLSIAQKITASHGGKIAASSTVGEGTTFTVSLPIIAA